jgi:hypothetical protein
MNIIRHQINCEPDMVRPLFSHQQDISDGGHTQAEVRYIQRATFRSVQRPASVEQKGDAWMMTMKAFRKKSSWCKFRHYPGFCLNRRKTSVRIAGVPGGIRTRIQTSVMYLISRNRGTTHPQVTDGGYGGQLRIYWIRCRDH